MDAHSGMSFVLDTDFVPPSYFPPIGEQVDMEDFRGKVAQAEALGKKVSDDVRAAAQAQSLVMVSEEAAQKLKLGAREQERRKKRRKAEREARRRNR